MTFQDELDRSGREWIADLLMSVLAADDFLTPYQQSLIGDVPVSVQRWLAGES